MKDGFMSDDEIVADIVATLTEADLAILRVTKEEDLILFHHGYGTHIRNYYRLWDEKNPFTDNRDAMGDRFADQVSQGIIEKVWAKVTALTQIVALINQTDPSINGVYELPNG